MAASRGERRLEGLLRQVDRAVGEAEGAEYSTGRRPRRGARGDPLRQLSHRSYQQAMGLLAQARAGAFVSSSEETKRRLLARFIRLLTEANVPLQRRNALQGVFDEAIRTPRRSTAQQAYRAGGPQLPGQSSAGTARPDYDATIRAPSGALRRVHVNLKSDRIAQLTQGDAVGRARRYTNDAFRNAVQLPVGEPIGIRYAEVPPVEVQQAMLAQHFRPGSPIYAVSFGTTVYRNPNLPLL